MVIVESLVIAVAGGLGGSLGARLIFGAVDMQMLSGRIPSEFHDRMVDCPAFPRYRADRGYHQHGISRVERFETADCRSGPTEGRVG